MTAGPPSDENERRAQEVREKYLAAFPFERVQVLGSQALREWTRLKSAGRGVPIIVGDDEAVARLADPFGRGSDRRAVVDILKRVETIQHPQGLIAKRAADSAEALASIKKSLEQRPDMPLPMMTVIGPDGQPRTLSRDEVLAKMLDEQPEPKVGDWPRRAMRSPGLSVALDLRTGKPLSSVTIVLVPTDDWTTVPAHLEWGGWNDNPDAEFHVAAFRSWRERYGAELVGIAPDTLNLRVARRPRTRDEALALAREQYVYCADIIDQGAETYSQLAATLMADPWWYFWWD